MQHEKSEITGQDPMAALACHIFFRITVLCSISLFVLSLTLAPSIIRVLRKITQGSKECRRLTPK
jgi:hypothetical protein